MAEKSGFVGVALSVTFVLLLSSSVSNGQVNITTQPMNVTVCLTQSTTATFTCVVDRGGVSIFTAGWRILEGGMYVLIPQNRRPRHMTNDTINGDIITDTLTVTNVSADDNGAQYRCQPVDSVPSITVTITVLALPPDVIEVTDICTSDFTVSWNSTKGLTYIVSILPPNMMSGTSVGPTMDTTNTFTDLMPNTVYAVSVNSIMDTCTGIPNTVMVMTLSEAMGLPQSVSNLESTSTTDTITIEWNSVIGHSDCGSVHYIVTVVNLMDDRDTRIFNQMQNKIDFTNLMIGVNYTISVAAVNRAGSGPLSTINVTGNAEVDPDPIDDDDDDDNDNTGAIIGGIIGGIVFLVIISAIIVIIVIWWRNYRNQNDNGEKLTSSKSPESPSPVQSDKSNQKSKKREAKSVEQKPLHDAPQYADLQHGKPGALPSVDHSKVAYSHVKEHEPLNYAQVEHKPGSDEKPIKGAPQVEYKEVWHQ